MFSKLCTDTKQGAELLCISAYCSQRNSQPTFNSGNCIYLLEKTIQERCTAKPRYVGTVGTAYQKDEEVTEL